MSSITLITGAPGSGKSTVAGLVAARFARCMVINVDQLREMMLSGKCTPGDVVPEEGHAQFRRARAAAVHMARINAAEGVDVIIDDVCFPPSFAGHYAELFAIPGARRILLLPSLEALLERMKRRAGPWDDILIEHAPALYDYLLPMPKDGWTVLDTSEWSIEDTIDRVASIVLTPPATNPD